MASLGFRFSGSTRIIHILVYYYQVRIVRDLFDIVNFEYKILGAPVHPICFQNMLPETLTLHHGHIHVQDSSTLYNLSCCHSIALFAVSPWRQIYISWLKECIVWQGLTSSAHAMHTHTHLYSLDTCAQARVLSKVLLSLRRTNNCE